VQHVVLRERVFVQVVERRRQLQADEQHAAQRPVAREPPVVAGRALRGGAEVLRERAGDARQHQHGAVRRVVVRQQPVQHMRVAQAAHEAGLACDVRGGGPVTALIFSEDLGRHVPERRKPHRPNLREGACTELLAPLALTPVSDPRPARRPRSVDEECARVGGIAR